MNCTAREVWGRNAEREFRDVVSKFADSFYNSYVFIDTEFPGFLHRTPLHASPEERYQDMKRNVDMMKIIQLGFTFGNDMGLPIRCCWQVNFKEFDPAVDPRAERSVRLLRDSGIDFDRNRRDGVDAATFSKLLWQTLIVPCRSGGLKLVMFHGLYDLGYIVKLLLQEPLPSTLAEFMWQAQTLLGSFYDLKHIAKICGFDERIGLLKIANELGVDLEGNHHHQAGYDSLLIGKVFWKIKERFGIKEDEFVWIIHGAELGCSSMPISGSASNSMHHDRLLPVAAPVHLAPYACFPPTNTSLDPSGYCFVRLMPILRPQTQVYSYLAPALTHQGQGHGCFAPGLPHYA